MTRKGFSLGRSLRSRPICPWLISVPLVGRKGLPNFKTSHPWLHLTRSVSGLAAFGGLLFAVKFIPLVDAVLLISASPLWIPFVILAWKREGIYRHLWWGIIVGFAGVILVLHPDAKVFHFGSIIGLGTGLMLAIGYVSVRLLTATEPLSRIVFYFMFLGTLVSLPFAIVQWTAPTATDWWLLIAIGLSMAANQYLINWALSLARPSVIGPMAFSSPVFAGLIGWMVWHEVPTGLTLLGMLLVIAGGTACILAGQKSKTEH